MASFLGTPQSLSSAMLLPITPKGGSSGATTMEQLTDVKITQALSAGQVLAYVTSSATWNPMTISGTLSLQGLTTDVAITEGTTPLANTNTNSVLCWTGTKWGAKALTLADLPSSIVNSGTTTNGLYAPVVVTTTPTSGQVLAYSTSSGGQWMPTTATSVTTIQTCTDVDITEGGTNLGTSNVNTVLYWNGADTNTGNTHGRWNAKILAMKNNDLSDVVLNVSALANNQLLQYVNSSSSWANWNPTYLNSINSLTGTNNNLQLPLDSLSNVSASGKTGGQVLTWNATSSAWTPTTVSTTAITIEALTDVSIASNQLYMNVATTNGIYQTNDLNTYTLICSPSAYPSGDPVIKMLQCGTTYILITQNQTSGTSTIYSSTNLTSWTNIGTIYYQLHTTYNLFVEDAYYDGTNLLIFGFPGSGGSYNCVFTPISSISYTFVNIGNGGSVESVAYCGGVYICCTANSPYWYATTALTSTWINFKNSENYGSCCTNGTQVLCCGGSGGSSFYFTASGGNIGTITTITPNGSAPVGGCQVCTYNSTKGVWIFADMNTGTGVGFQDSVLQGTVAQWTNFNWVYTQQYSYKNDNWFAYAIGATTYMVRSHQNGNVEYSANLSSWSAIPSLASGWNTSFSFNTWVSSLVSTVVNNDLMLYKNPTSKWVNLNSQTIYRKLAVPIRCLVNSSFADITSSTSVVNPTLGFEYSMNTSTTTYLILHNFSMPYDWLEGSSINLVLHLSLPSGYTSGTLPITIFRYTSWQGNLGTLSANPTVTQTLNSNPFDFQISGLSMTSVLTSYTNTIYFQPLSSGTYSNTFIVYGVDLIYQSNCYGSSSVFTKT